MCVIDAGRRSVDYSNFTREDRHEKTDCSAISHSFESDFSRNGCNLVKG